ncbi:STAS domain-containing protein [Streptomyces sp. NPDC020362]|uniref:STAS domain-containing protein n=1 Tax=unclassified Streptomyces TaxID=2593676 RepID=UPI000A6FEDA9
MRQAAPWEPTAGTTGRPQPPSSRVPLTTHGEAPALFEECRIVRARGELDAQTLAPLARALAEARAARPGRLLLIVDLSEVTFTDCSILTPLCEAWSDCCARGGWMRIVHDNHTTDLVFRHTGLLDRFPAYATAQDAWEGRTADTDGPEPGAALVRGLLRPRPGAGRSHPDVAASDPALRLTASALLAAEAHRPAEDDVPRRTTRQDTS